MAEYNEFINKPGGHKLDRKSVGEKVIYPELSYSIVKIAFDIHNSLGPGFTENIYETAFVYELENNRIAFERQKPIKVCYKGIVLGDYRFDLLVDQKIIVELKAVAMVNDLFKQQVLSYLKAGDYRLGLLINFGAKRLEHFRIVHYPLFDKFVHSSYSYLLLSAEQLQFFILDKYYPYCYS